MGFVTKVEIVIRLVSEIQILSICKRLKKRGWFWLWVNLTHIFLPQNQKTKHENS